MIAADGRIYCGGRLGNFTALDATSGEILWKTHHPGVESRPAPTYADGKLLIMRSRNGQGDSPYVSGASGGPAGEGLWCHDAATGKVLWHRPLSFRYHYNHDGLVVHDGKVFVTHGVPKGPVQAIAFAIDSGEEAWRQNLDLEGKPSKLPPRFSGVMAGGLWCVSISDQGTLGLDPSTGKIEWTRKDLSITLRARVAARDGVLLVFNNDGDHALDARTGEPLWKGAAKSTRYSQALTDRYMNSKGQQGIYPPAVCAWPIYANGFWYSHHSFSTAHGSNKLAAIKEPDDREVGVLTDKMVGWSHEFTSNACPSPTPAYGRLYYSPASEGVVYCFAPKESAVPPGNR
jgi:outer membrane protein assembly factor BamB